MILSIFHELREKFAIFFFFFFFTKKINVKFYTKPVPCFPGFALIFPLFLMSFLLGSDEILMPGFSTNYANNFLPVFAVSGPFTSFLVLHTISWFSRSEVCAFVWGIFVRGLCVETFVRVLRSSELSLNNCK